MSKEVDEMRAKVAHHLRFTKQYPMVAIEANALLIAFNTGGQADVLAVDKKGQVIEVEIKISIADLRKDVHKAKHYWLWRDHFGEEPAQHQLAVHRAWKREQMLNNRGNSVNLPPCHLFYFAVPDELVNKARAVIDELYPYAGLLSVNREMQYTPTYIFMAKEAKKFNRPKIGPVRLSRMAREMSATLCRLAMDLAGVKRL